MIILKLAIFTIILLFFAVDAIAYSIFRKFDKSIHPNLEKDKTLATVYIGLIIPLMPFLLVDCFIPVPFWYLGIAAFVIFLITALQVKFVYWHGEIPSLSTNTEGGDEQWHTN
jgi:hypothetical protein